jgi:hypothetical protein
MRERIFNPVNLIEHIHAAPDGALKTEPRIKRAELCRPAHGEFCVRKATGSDQLCTIHATVAARARQASLERFIRDCGYRLRYVEFCEDAATPGLVGYYGGVTSHARRDVKISTKRAGEHGVRARSIFQIVDILRHEARHVADPGWTCGNQPVVSVGMGSRST